MTKDILEAIIQTDELISNVLKSMTRYMCGRENLKQAGKMMHKEGYAFSTCTICLSIAAGQPHTRK